MENKQTIAIKRRKTRAKQNKNPDKYTGAENKNVNITFEILISRKSEQRAYVYSATYTLTCYNNKWKN